MHPILLKLGPITIYSYGAMVALGFILAVFLIYRRANSFGIEKEQVIDLALILLVSGIMGARIFYVVFNYRYYLAHPLDILNLSKGGLVWYGGFSGALIVLLIYIIRKRLNFWLVTDMIAPYLALAQSFGRIGCFLNGCCFGITTGASNPVAISFPGETALRHPSELYSALSLFLIFNTQVLAELEPYQRRDILKLLPFIFDKEICDGVLPRRQSEDRIWDDHLAGDKHLRLRCVLPHLHI